MISFVISGLSSLSSKLQNDNSEEFSELPTPSSSEPVKSLSSFLTYTFGAPWEVFLLKVDKLLVELENLVSLDFLDREMSIFY